MGCCGNASNKYEYNNKTQEISKQNMQTLEKFGQGAAARNYTKNMKLDLIKQITEMKKPQFVEGKKMAVDSKEQMMTDEKLNKILAGSEYTNLSWNNYFEDIGEDRKYRGQWIKPGDWDDKSKTKGLAKTRGGDTPNEPTKVNKSKKTQWMGFGIIEFPDGSKYYGQTDNGEFNGTGRMVHPNGDIYQGEWKDGMAHGKGVFCDVRGSLYEGQWVSDMQHGKGVELWDFNAIKYEGDFHEGKKTGKGKFWFEGSTYQGDFVEGKFHGKGKYYFAESGKIYEGNFADNQLEGQGVMTWPDQGTYVGEFHEGKMHGQGKRTFENGNHHEGSYALDKAHGPGRIYHAADGSYREGTWDMGKADAHWQVNGAKVRGSAGTDVFKKYKGQTAATRAVGAFMKANKQTR